MSFDLSNLTEAEYDQLITDLLAKLRTSPRGVFTPIDLQNLTTIAETGAWVDELPQPQEGWRLNGGAPDPANNKGILTWLLEGYANRTAFLKAALGGIGGVAESAVDLDALTKSGIFLFAEGAAGNPVGGVMGAAIHAESETGEAWQFAVSSNGKSFSRVRSDVAPTWSAWRHMIDDQGGTVLGQMILGGVVEVSTLAKLQIDGFTRGGSYLMYAHEDDNPIQPLVPGSHKGLLNREADNRLLWDNSPIWTDANGARNFSLSGYEKLPSGWIWQWAWPSAINNGLCTFPIAFPTACCGVMLTENHPNARVTLAAHGLTTTGYTLKAFDISNNAELNTITQHMMLAYGY